MLGVSGLVGFRDSGFMGFRATAFGYLGFRGSGSRIWVEGQEPEPVFDGLYDRGA